MEPLSGFPPFLRLNDDPFYFSTPHLSGADDDQHLGCLHVSAVASTAAMSLSLGVSVRLCLQRSESVPSSAGAGL